MWQFYHENGELAREGLYVDGRMDGVWIAWHDHRHSTQGASWIDNLEIYLDLTRELVAAADPPEIIVWPESAATFFLDEEPRYRSRIAQTLSSSTELLIGTPRSPVEGRVGESRVVLLDVELDETSDLGLRVQAIEEQPLVLEHAPPCFDQGVGKRDLRLPQDPLEEAGVHDGVDVLVVVLDAAVGGQGGRLGFTLEVRPRLHQ